MQPEYEVKILDIDVEDMLKRLEQAGAKKVAERNMRRYTYDLRPGVWLRLRDEGTGITLAVKEKTGTAIGGVLEQEVPVQKFTETHELLQVLGFVHFRYQENRRISFLLDGVHIEIDFWPMIPAYLEIEGTSAEQVQQMVERLGFRMEQTTTLSCKDVYSRCGIDLESIKDLKAATDTHGPDDQRSGSPSCSVRDR